MFVDDGLKYCLKEITRDGNCPPNDGPVECSAEFIYALGSTSRAGDVGMLPNFIVVLALNLHNIINYQRENVGMIEIERK